MSKGFTFIEIIVSIALLILFALGAYQGYATVFAAAAAAHHKQVAVELANERFEIARNLPYTNVGTVGGNPAGVLTASTTIVRDLLSFRVNTTVVYVDDTYDGVAGGADAFPRDYKLMEISVDCVSCKQSSPVVITGRIAPANLEN